VFWYVFYLVLHFVIIKPFMTARKDKHFLAMSKKEQMFYTTYYHGIAHAILSSCLSLYCFAFADG